MRCGARTVFQRDWRVEAAEVVCAPAVAVAEDDVVVVGTLMLAAGCAEDVRLVNLAISIESRLRDADVAAGLVQHAQAVADAQLEREAARLRVCQPRRGRGNGCGRGAPWPRGCGGALRPAPPRGAAFRGCVRRGCAVRLKSSVAVAQSRRLPCAPLRRCARAGAQGGCCVRLPRLLRCLHAALACCARLGPSRGSNALRRGSPGAAPAVQLVRVQQRSRRAVLGHLRAHRGQRGRELRRSGA